MNRTGLGRHGGIEDAAGDPLDGLVNLFDVGLVLAVAFLVAGLGLAVTGAEPRDPERAAALSGQAGRERALPDPSGAPSASGRGQEVGKVYRLGDGRLILVEPEPPSGE